MATQRKSNILIFVVTLATTIVMASTTLSATPEPIAIQPKIAVTTAPHALESKAPPASDQANSEKQEKKKGQRTGMLITLFAVITGHQGTTR
jgi:uncharacterized iron-regulated membrane protein